MKIVVTGSDGYIGRGVVQHLLAEGHEVVALGLSPCGIDAPNLEEIIGDAFAYDFAAHEMPDVLLHLAWRNGFVHNDTAHLDDLPKHYRFLKAAAEAGIPRIVGMGTMHEVGYYEGMVDEFTPCNPTTPYGVSKNALRQLLCELCRQNGAQFQWLRGFYLVSADGCGSSIFSKIVQAAHEGKEEFPLTSGKTKYDFLPYREFCDQVAAAVTQGNVCGVINICSGKPVALGKYIEQFVRENKLNIKLAYGRYPDRPYDSPAIWGDSTKINAILATRGGR